ncbi:MAG: COX15/CtaA family protein [Acidimicrobiales bacterium]
MTAGSPPPGPAGRRLRIPIVSPLLFRRLSIASLVAVCLIVLTGAAVRLTGSGLGCPDWPSCYQRQLTPQLSFHPVVEFSNRLVTVVLTVLIAATLLAAIRRRPFRADLTWLSVGLLGGVVAQAVIGAIAVYTKLNPYVVVLHFLASMALVAVVVLLVHRSNRDYSPGTGTALVPKAIRLGARALLVLLGTVLVAGTFTTGAGPHAGNAQGQLVARRIPIAFRDMAELHSSLAILLVGVAVGLTVALHAMAVPERIRRAARILCGTLVLQAAVGYTQYFTHLPAALVEVHVLGATALVVGSMQFFVSLTDHPPEKTAVVMGEPEASEHSKSRSVGVVA